VLWFSCKWRYISLCFIIIIVVVVVVIITVRKSMVLQNSPFYFHFWCILLWYCFLVKVIWCDDVSIWRQHRQQRFWSGSSPCKWWLVVLVYIPVNWSKIWATWTFITLQCPLFSLSHALFNLPSPFKQTKNKAIRCRLNWPLCPLNWTNERR